MSNDPTPTDPTATWSSPMDLPFTEEPPTEDTADATTRLAVEGPASVDPTMPSEPPVPDQAPAPVEAAAYAAPSAYVRAPVLRGPSPWTVILGLVGLSVAVLVFLTTATSVRIDWTTAGPATVVGFGGVLVLLGLLGMLSRRRTTH